MVQQCNAKPPPAIMLIIGLTDPLVSEITLNEGSNSREIQHSLALPSSELRRANSDVLINRTTLA